MRFFVAIHRVVDLHPQDPMSAVGLGIDVATRLRWGGPGGTAPPGGWVLGEPATHAFCAVVDDAGAKSRIDAGYPRTEKVEWRPPTVPTAIWEILESDTGHGKVNPNAGARVALQAVGTPYDLAQCFMQALAVFVRAPLPGLPPPPMKFKADPGKVICTEEACRALEACGGPAAMVARDVMRADHYPEELGGRLQNCVGASWLRRVDTVE